MCQVLEPETLAQWVTSGAHGVVIVDVRDSDYKYVSFLMPCVCVCVCVYSNKLKGRIKGSIHIPSRLFASRMDELLSYPPNAKFVFHCMRSERRGPRCARAFASKSHGEVYLLRGGLKLWNELYGTDPELMEGII